MNREQILRALVGLDGFALEQADLEKLNDESLKALAKANGIDCGCGGSGGSAPVANAGAPKAEGEGAKEGAEPKAEAGVTLSAEEAGFLRGLMGNHADLQAALAAGRRAYEQENAEKAAIVKRLAANAKCAISEELLKGMELQALKGLEETIAPTDFSGAGTFGANFNAEDDRYIAPVPVFAASEEGAA